MYLGIEIGGSKLQLGIGLGDGTIRALWRDKVDVARGAEGIREQIVNAVPELLRKAGLGLADLRGAGIGFGGPVDDATHTVIRSHQIYGWDGFPLADWMGDAIGLPAILGNDADVAGLAEALFGAGKGLSPIFYITIGSGIGGGLIINGEIYRGCGRGAAEIGHLNSHYHVDSTVEYHASGWGIAKFARSWLETDLAQANQSILPALVNGNAELLTAKHVAEAASRRDECALTILDVSFSTLADAIGDVVTLLCPRRIIIGGGVSLMGETLLFEPLRRMVAERVFEPFRDCYDIVPAALGEEVVVHGALALARRKFGEEKP
jgi:glucokinase